MTDTKFGGKNVGRPIPSIEFKVTDGIKPKADLTRPGFPAKLCAPVPLKIGEMINRQVDLGISCNVPVFVQTTVGSPSSKMFAADEPIKIQLSTLGEMINVSDGEQVALAWPIVNRGSTWRAK